MKFILEITTDNAAFADDMGSEVSRILLEAAGKAACGLDGDSSGSCIDYNGNRVGYWQIETNARGE